MYRHNCHPRLRNWACACVYPTILLSVCRATGLCDAGHFFISVYKFFVDIWQDSLLGGERRIEETLLALDQTLHIQAPGSGRESMIVF
jgi:hypothetical protein